MLNSNTSKSPLEITIGVIININKKMCNIDKPYTNTITEIILYSMNIFRFLRKYKLQRETENDPRILIIIDFHAKSQNRREID